MGEIMTESCSQAINWTYPELIDLWKSREINFWKSMESDSEDPLFELRLMISESIFFVGLREELNHNLPDEATMVAALHGEAGETEFGWNLAYVCDTDRIQQNLAKCETERRKYLLVQAGVIQSAIKGTKQWLVEHPEFRPRTWDQIYADLVRDFTPADAPQAAPATLPTDTPLMAGNVAPWPEPMHADAFYGLAGRFVDLVERHTEADRNLLLVLFLVYSGHIMGRNAYVVAGGDHHHANLFACAVGPTSAGRKGSATAPVERFFTDGDRASGLGQRLPSLSTGEGLIWAIRDEVRGKVFNKRSKEYEEVVTAEGIDDKRLICNLGEFVGALQVMRREGNTLSPVVRSAWDSGILVSPTKNSPAKATGAHVSIIGNISKEELTRAVEETDADNGLLNRFLWVCSRRSKLLPEGGKLWQLIESREWRELQEQFNRATLMTPRRLERDGEAGDLWGRDSSPGNGVYADLSRERYGLAGQATARAHAQVLRLSLIYAVLDGAQDIRREHLDSALAVWKYCESSARYIFGEAVGDPTADAIVRALRMAPTGMTRSELFSLFNRHKPANEINRGCLVLHHKGLARFERVETNGRPVERWFATSGGGAAK
jgi:hypothetical protein